jgi:hypothetical protein
MRNYFFLLLLLCSHLIVLLLQVFCASRLAVENVAKAISTNHVLCTFNSSVNMITLASFKAYEQDINSLLAQAEACTRESAQARQALHDATQHCIEATREFVDSHSSQSTSIAMWSYRSTQTQFAKRLKFCSKKTAHAVAYLHACVQSLDNTLSTAHAVVKAPISSVVSEKLHLDAASTQHSLQTLFMGNRKTCKALMILIESFAEMQVVKLNTPLVQPIFGANNSLVHGSVTQQPIQDDKDNQPVAHQNEEPPLQLPNTGSSPVYPQASSIHPLTPTQNPVSIDHSPYSLQLSTFHPIESSFMPSRTIDMPRTVSSLALEPNDQLLSSPTEQHVPVPIKMQPSPQPEYSDCDQHFSDEFSLPPAAQPCFSGMHSPTSVEQSSGPNGKEPLLEVITPPPAPIIAQALPLAITHPYTPDDSQQTPSIVAQPTPPIVTPSVVAPPISPDVTRPQPPPVVTQSTPNVSTQPAPPVVSPPSPAVSPQLTSPDVTYPTPSVVTSPTPSTVTQPIPPVLSQPTRPVLSQPTAPVLSQPTVPIVTQPTPSVVPQPAPPVVPLLPTANEPVAPLPPVTAPASPITASTPPVTAPAPPVTASAPPVTAPTPPITAPAPPPVTFASPIDTRAPPIDTPAPPINIPAPPIDTPALPINPPAPPIKTSAPPIDTPASPIHTPASPIHTPASPIHTPAPPIHTPAPPIDTPAPPMNLPAPPIDAPAPPINSPAPPIYTPAPPIQYMYPPPPTNVTLPTIPGFGTGFTSGGSSNDRTDASNSMSSVSNYLPFLSSLFGSSSMGPINMSLPFANRSILTKRQAEVDNESDFINDKDKVDAPTETVEQPILATATIVHSRGMKSVIESNQGADTITKCKCSDDSLCDEIKSTKICESECNDTAVTMSTSSTNACLSGRNTELNKRSRGRNTPTYASDNKLQAEAEASMHEESQMHDDDEESQHNESLYANVGFPSQRNLLGSSDTNDEADNNKQADNNDRADDTREAGGEERVDNFERSDSDGQFYYETHSDNEEHLFDLLLSDSDDELWDRNKLLTITRAANVHRNNSQESASVHDNASSHDFGKVSTQSTADVFMLPSIILPNDAAQMNAVESYSPPNLDSTDDETHASENDEESDRCRSPNHDSPRSHPTAPLTSSSLSIGLRSYMYESRLHTSEVDHAKCFAYATRDWYDQVRYHGDSSINNFPRFSENTNESCDHEEETKVPHSQEKTHSVFSSEPFNDDSNDPLTSFGVTAVPMIAPPKSTHATWPTERGTLTSNEAVTYTSVGMAHIPALVVQNTVTQSVHRKINVPVITAQRMQASPAFLKSGYTPLGSNLTACLPSYQVLPATTSTLPSYTPQTHHIRSQSAYTAMTIKSPVTKRHGNVSTHEPQ